jgi:(E)-4-hydroxy-3-methylbut-2-enyl-diphosphate synthase
MLKIFKPFNLPYYPIKTDHCKYFAVMGCIVNGPGEMADADYGYVGSERGKISLYKKQQLVEKNIPADQAVERLIRLLKENGDWVEPDEN